MRYEREHVQSVVSLSARCRELLLLLLPPHSNAAAGTAPSCIQTQP